MYDYISIDQTINRLNEVLGLEGWSFEINETKVELLPADIVTSSGKRQYLAVVTGTLKLADQTGYLGQPGHSGIGADISNDVDKAVKTALANALKKAGNQVGIALYLWSEEERAALSAIREQDINALKTLVAGRAVREGLDIRGMEQQQAGQAIAKHFGVPVTDLSDPIVLTRLAEER